MSELREAGSPYLRQHASDPVAWRAWGAAPFADAERRDLPVLVSIGYAACHWCHVMQRESFRDPETAAWLNERFIAVKVDREEHPDVDAYYMTALQALRGQGGWPLTAVTDTQGRPFFAGTYLPPNDRPGMPSFRRVMDSVSDAWRERRALVLEDAERLHAHLEGGMAAPPGSRWDPPATPHAQTDAASEADADPALDAVATELRDAEREALQACQARIDETHGGMSGAPKFPPHGLLRWWSRLDDADARRWRDRALTSLAHGGIADPLAGGVARYAVDEAWRVPHFEKMLSDNVQLLPRWAEAWRDGNDPTHLAAVRSTFAWLEAEMRLPGGLYATALDADSPGADGRSEEGAFYAWTANAFDEAVRDAVGDDAVAFARDAYGVSDVGPFEGRNVLRRTASDAELAARHGRTPDGAAEARERIRTALAAVRAERTRPARDDKALCGLQGLAILGLARAGRLCGEDAMIQRARELARATLDRFLDADGRLWRRAFGDRVGIAARLEDHAALGTGLLELHRADGDPAWARAAERRADAVMRDFADPDQGGFLSAPADPDDPLPLRPRALLDGALPADTVTAAELVFAV
ncbi:MAG: thioredoxin domain-containing protein, partial [Trueperaceae bacterium]